MAEGQAAREKPCSTHRGLLTPKVLANPVTEEFLPIISPPLGLEEEFLALEPETSASPPELHTPKPPRVDKTEYRDITSHSRPLPRRNSNPTSSSPPATQGRGAMALREQRYTGVDEDGHMVERCVFTYLPFTSADLINWKNNNLSYSKKTQLSLTYCKLLFRLTTPLGLIATSCLCIFLTCMKAGEYSKLPPNEHVPAHYQNPQKYVRVQLRGTDPQWDPNTLEGMQRLIQYREALLEGLKKGSPEGYKISKVSEVIQGKEESPAQFYERLCEAYHMYTAFNTESPENQCMLLEIANQVFVNRDTVSHRESCRENECQARRNADLIAAAIRGAPQEWGWGVWKATSLIAHACSVTSVLTVRKWDTRRTTCPLPLLGRNLLSKLRATPITFTDKGSLQLKLPQAGIITALTEGWRLFLTKPGTKDYRPVQALRLVNQTTVTLHPLAPNSCMLLRLSSAEDSWFTCLDLKNAFFSIGLVLESQKQFAFQWENPETGVTTQYTWTWLPQGFRNSPTIFGEALAHDLQKFLAKDLGCMLLHYAGDLLLGHPIAVGLWIPNFAVLAKPLYKVTKWGDKEPFKWGSQQWQAYQKLKAKLLSAPALRLPDLTKPLMLGTLAQACSISLQAAKRSFPRKAPCLRALATTALLAQEANKLALQQNSNIKAPHTVETLMNTKGHHWLTNARLTKYQSLLCENPCITIEVCNTLNPASLPPMLEGPVKHICVKYGTQFTPAGLIFGISHGRRQGAGCAAVTLDTAIGTMPLPQGTLAQKTELTALAWAIELSEIRL
ncbi:LOW QUALITY PROTEIN: Gag-Pol polyprotein [Plecturocebus cupreus]